MAASSIYSEAPNHALWSDEYHGISPPDSPRFSAEYRDDGRVSPVEEHPDELRYSKAASSKYSSYIPVPRKPSAGE